MDTITRRSAILATVIHATLVACTLMPNGCSLVPDPSSPPPPSVSTTTPPPPPEPAPEAQPTYGAVVAVPLATPRASTPLPALSPAGLPPLPDPAQLVSAVRQDHTGNDTSRGDRGRAVTAIDLPTLPANPDDLITRLQHSRVSNEAMSREQRMLATAQEFLHGRLQGEIGRHWRHLLKEVTESRLVIEIRVDRRGKLTYSHLVNSSGSLTLDRLIGEWLAAGDLNLPPITADIVYPFLITLRR